MMRQIIDLHELGVEHYYSDISDNTLLYYDSKGPLIGASGLLSKDGIFKPSFFAMKFWTKLGDHIIDSGEHYTVTAQGDSSYQILSYNSKEFNQNYFVKEENQIYVQELNTIFKDTDKLQQRFELHHVKNKKYCIRILRLKETEGSALCEWGKLGNGEKLMREEIDYLKKMSVPRMHVAWESVSDNFLEINLTLDPNEIILVTIQ
jgi:beta-xylosidase